VCRLVCLLRPGRNEARWRPGQEASLAPPYSNLRSFGSKRTVLKKVLLIMLGLFGARGIMPPSPPSLRPCLRHHAFGATSFCCSDKNTWQSFKNQPPIAPEQLLYLLKIPAFAQDGWTKACARIDHCTRPKLGLLL